MLGTHKAALDNPLPAPSRSRREATKLNQNRRGAPGSGCQAFDVSPRKMTQRFATILAVLLSTAISAALAGETAKSRDPVIEIYDYTGDEEIFLDAPTLEEIEKHGTRLFSDADISDLKPVEGFEGRFTVEVRASGKEQFLKTVFSGYVGQLVIVIDGKPRAETLHACAGCRVIDGSFGKDELRKIRTKLSRREKPKQKPGD